MSIKKAYKITPAALNRRNIEKTSVKLAVSIFCESTRDALQFYASHQGHAEWKSTADFLSLIIKLWNVMNVKTSHKGEALTRLYNGSREIITRLEVGFPA